MTSYAQGIARQVAALLVDIKTERAVEAVVETVIEELIERCAREADRHRAALIAELGDRADSAHVVAAEEIAINIRALAASPVATHHSFELRFLLRFLGTTTDMGDVALPDEFTKLRREVNQFVGRPW